MTYEESNDDAISSLFQDTIVKLDKVEAQSKESKKQIIVDLAKELERKIPTDTVSIEIVNQLRGRISERFIHECLDEKYKQKVRVRNARRQKQKQKNEEDIKEVDDKLAVLPPLNQEGDEGEEDKEEVVMLVDATDGSTTYIQKDDDTKSNTTTPVTNTTFKTPYNHHQQLQSQPNQYQEIEQEITKEIDSQEIKCPSCKDLYFENCQLKEVIEKSNQFIPAEKMAQSTSIIEGNRDDTNDSILSCEFSMLFGDIRKYAAPPISTMGDNGQIWFNIKIDKRTAEVISSNLGRANQ